jgi:hypothetical protein
VIETAMAKDPEARYVSAGDFARDASAALKGLRYSGPPTTVATGEATPLPGDLDGQAPPVELGQPETTAAVPDLPETAAAAEPPAAVAPVGPPAPPPAAPPPGPPSAPAEPPAPPAPAARRRFPYGWAVAVGALLVAGGVAAAVALSSGGGGSSASKNAPAGLPFASSAQPVPTNRVTGSGTGNLQLVGDTVTVSVNTNGLLNGSAHAMHIHAGGTGVCPTAAAARPHNGHLSINTGDGLNFYGPPAASLTTSGDTSTKSIIDFPRFPSVGNIRYSRTFSVTPTLAREIQRGNAVLVVHGIDYNDNGIYDNVLGTSDLSKALPAEGTAPALCGPLFSTKTASEGTTYEASLAPTVPTPADDPRAGLLCHLSAA